MPRHGNNATDRSFFSYHEKKKMKMGSITERVGADSLKNFDACCLCLHTVRDPVTCLKGHLFCKECVFENLMAQKQEINRRERKYEIYMKEKKAEEDEARAEQQRQQLEDFERTDLGVLPVRKPEDAKKDDEKEKDKDKDKDKEESVIATSFWVPSNTPQADPTTVTAPDKKTYCTEGGHHLRLKDLVTVQFSKPRDVDLHDPGAVTTGRYQCASCVKQFTNGPKVGVLKGCGHAYCWKCIEKAVKPDKMCPICSKKVSKDKDIIVLQQGGTGFAGHGDKLESKVRNAQGIC
eukprot:GFYU01010143.1.p1 GENE.GFYU01010143.1~~GFYU01010143.1.p1  ORF type:complete len:292 (-),score=69.24 GFYU01010143.1:75-950(-)